MHWIRIPGIVILALVATACFHDGEEAEQQYYFASIYANRAWGFQYEGRYVDSDGGIQYFSLDSPEDVNIDLASSGLVRSEEPPAYTRAELEALFSNNRFHGPAMAPGFRDGYHELALKAHEGEFSEEGAMFDAGLVTHMVFIHSPLQDLYTPVVLRTCGDLHLVNETEAADILYERFQAARIGYFPNC